MVRERYGRCGASWTTPMAAILAAVQTEHVRPTKAGRSDCGRMLWPPGRAEPALTLRCERCGRISPRRVRICDGCGLVL